MSEAYDRYTQSITELTASIEVLKEATGKILAIAEDLAHWHDRDLHIHDFPDGYEPAGTTSNQTSPVNINKRDWLSLDELKVMIDRYKKARTVANNSYGALDDVSKEMTRPPSFFDVGGLYKRGAI